MRAASKQTNSTNIPAAQPGGECHFPATRRTPLVSPRDGKSTARSKQKSRPRPGLLLYLVPEIGIEPDTDNRRVEACDSSAPSESDRPRLEMTKSISSSNSKPRLLGSSSDPKPASANSRSKTSINSSRFQSRTERKLSRAESEPKQDSSSDRKRLTNGKCMHVRDVAVAAGRWIYKKVEPNPQGNQAKDHACGCGATLLPCVDIGPIRFNNCVGQVRVAFGTFGGCPARGDRSVTCGALIHVDRRIAILHLHSSVIRCTRILNFSHQSHSHPSVPYQLAQRSLPLYTHTVLVSQIPTSIFLAAAKALSALTGSIT